MAQQNIPQDSEVDLGSLFKVIGKGFKNIFTAIGKFFNGFGHVFILLLIFLKKHALKLGIAAVLGGLGGLYLDFTQPPKYSSTMIVEPNFKSSQQLYQNINFYHELVRQKDWNLLAEVLNISSEEASKLKGFYIKPIKNDNEKYELFDEFIQEIDTATVRSINVYEFKKSFTNFDYKFHRIKVMSLDNLIFKKLSSPIVNSVENNPYFENQKKMNDQNLLLNERVLVKSLQEVDTLRKIYNQVLITEAQKNEPSTSITLAQGAKKTDELALFNESLELNEELIDNNREKANTAEILNVVTGFNEVGAKQRSILKKMTFIMALAAGLLMLLFILIRQLNSYLSTYKR